MDRRPRAVLALTAIVTTGLLGYGLTQLGLNMSHRALLSEDLPFWRAYNEFAQVFPILDEALLVVVDGESPSRVRKATQALASRLRQRSETFESVYVPGGGTFFERYGLLYLDTDEIEDLADHLATAQPLVAELSRDRSLQGLTRTIRLGMEHAQSDPTAPMNLSAVFDSVSLAARAVLEEQPRPISWSEALLRRSFPGDTSRRLIVLQPMLDYEQFLPAREPIRVVRRAARELNLADNYGASVRVTGNVALNYEEMTSLARQSVLATLGSLALVTLLLFVALGSKRLVGAVLATLLVGLVWTAAFAAAAVGHVNVVSVAFAVLFIGLGVDFGIHLAMRYAELMRGRAEHTAALAETARGVGGSLALCAMTTAIGFYAFVPTDYRAVAELGLISGTGMVISLFCSLTVLPALLTVSRMDELRLRPAPAAPRWFSQGLTALAFRRARAVRLAALALGLAALGALPFLRFDHNVARMRDPGAESVRAFEDLLADSEMSPWTIDVLAADLDAAGRQARRLAALEVVERAVTLADYVPEDQQEKLEILADVSLFFPTPPTFPEPAEPPSVADQVAALRALQESLRSFWLEDRDARRGASARRAERRLEDLLGRLEALEGRREEELLASFERSLIGELPEQMATLWAALDPGPVELADIPDDVARRMLAEDGRARIQVRPSEDLSDNEALARFVDGVRELEPAATGSAVSLLEWARATVRSLRQAFVSAFVAIGLFVWLLWRRLGDVWLVMAPLSLAALLTAACALVVGIPFNFANIVVLPLLLGIGVDSGIHLVHRYRELEAREAGDTAARELLGTSTARAVFFSALTTMGSFGSLALASHNGFAGLGRLLLIGVTLTLVCNLLVLPALIAGRGASAAAR